MMYEISYIYNGKSVMEELKNEFAQMEAFSKTG